jgi:hypothetical protein
LYSLIFTDDASPQNESFFAWQTPSFLLSTQFLPRMARRTRSFEKGHLAGFSSRALWRLTFGPGCVNFAQRAAFFIF